MTGNQEREKGADTGHRSGFVTVAGRPNVGKSTLINTFMGTSLLITSEKPQTTRDTIRCIWTGENFQVIFVDTPGLHRPRNELGRYMMNQALGTLGEVDLILFMVDFQHAPGPGDRFIADRLGEIDDIPKILVVNKLDLVMEMNERGLEKRRAEYESIGAFTATHIVSARTGTGLRRLADAIMEKLPPGPPYYPADELTDRPERYLYAEFIREQVLDLTREEVPHAVAVKVEKVRERENGVVYIQATIYVERESQKGILIGKKGRRLREIGRRARERIARLTGTKIYLDLWVKVKKDWRTKGNRLRQVGYR